MQSLSTATHGSYIALASPQGLCARSEAACVLHSRSCMVSSILVPCLCSLLRSWSRDTCVVNHAARRLCENRFLLFLRPDNRWFAFFLFIILQRRCIEPLSRMALWTLNIFSASKVSLTSPLAENQMFGALLFVPTLESPSGECACTKRRGRPLCMGWLQVSLTR